MYSRKNRWYDCPFTVPCYVHDKFVKLLPKCYSKQKQANEQKNGRHVLFRVPKYIVFKYFIDLYYWNSAIFLHSFSSGLGNLNLVGSHYLQVHSLVILKKATIISLIFLANFAVDTSIQNFTSSLAKSSLWSDNKLSYILL